MLINFGSFIFFYNFALLNLERLSFFDYHISTLTIDH